jgi:type II secretion system protein H
MFSKIRRKAGFTLVELMAAVVILGIIAAMVAPGFDEAIKKNKFKAQTREIVSLLRTARSNAIAEKIPVGLAVDYTENAIKLFEEKSSPPNNTFDDGVDSLLQTVALDTLNAYIMGTFTNSAVVFQPNGTASESGYIDYSYYDEGFYSHSTVSVLASTGRARVEYLQSDQF